MLRKKFVLEILDFLRLFEFFGLLLSFIFNFLNLEIFSDFFSSKLLGLLLKVPKGTNEHQKGPKIGQSSTIGLFSVQMAKKKSLGRSPPQELEESPRKFYNVPKT